MINRKIQNILVTGGAGFIGSAFIRYLLSPAVNFSGVCVNLDALTYAGNLENLKSIQSDVRYVFEKGDICQENLAATVCIKHKIDTIIHFAAQTHVDRSIDSPQAFLETNILGTFQLLEVVRKQPHIHFHHVSTDEVYGSLGPTGHFNELSPYQPNSPYAASKAASDHFVRAYQNTYNLSTCISNCSNNYGPYQYPEKLIPLVISNCLAGKKIPVYGNGGQVRDWLYVEDHAKALHLLLQNGRTGETYAIGGNAQWSNIDLIGQIIAISAEMTATPISDLQKLVTFVSDRPGHDVRYAIDHSKMSAEFGWQPHTLFLDGLRHTIAWYINVYDRVQRANLKIDVLAH